MIPSMRAPDQLGGRTRMQTLPQLAAGAAAGVFNGGYLQARCYKHLHSISSVSAFAVTQTEKTV